MLSKYLISSCSSFVVFFAIFIWSSSATALGLIPRLLFQPSRGLNFRIDGLDLLLQAQNMPGLFAQHFFLF